MVSEICSDLAKSTQAHNAKHYSKSQEDGRRLHEAVDGAPRWQVHMLESGGAQLCHLGLNSLSFLLRLLHN